MLCSVYGALSYHVQYTEHYDTLFSTRSLIMLCSVYGALSYSVQYTEPYHAMFSTRSIIISCSVHGALSYSVQYTEHYHTLFSTRSLIMLCSTDSTSRCDSFRYHGTNLMYNRWQQQRHRPPPSRPTQRPAGQT
jgi:hypothetical protein